MEYQAEELITAPAPFVARCVKCTKVNVPRGSWSKFHCVQCDIERKHLMDEAHVKVIGDPGLEPLGVEFFVEKSAALRRARGWTT